MPGNDSEQRLRDIVSLAPYLRVRGTKEGCEVSGQTDYCKGTRPVGDVAPDGLCVFWKWDGETVEVRNDRYGFSPIFYYAGEDEFIVSDSMPKLLALGAPADPDDPALNVFLHI